MPLSVLILVIYKYKNRVRIDVNYKTSRIPPVWEIAVHLAVAGDVSDGVFLCCPFSHEMCWMRSGTYNGANLMDYLSSGWSTERNICFLYIKMIVWACSYRIQHLPPWLIFSLQHIMYPLKI